MVTSDRLHREGVGGFLLPEDLKRLENKEDVLTEYMRFAFSTAQAQVNKQGCL